MAGGFHLAMELHALIRSGAYYLVYVLDVTRCVDDRVFY